MNECSMSDNYGEKYSPTFSEYFFMAAPIACFMLVLAYCVIYVKWGRNLNIRVPVDVVDSQMSELGPITVAVKMGNGTPGRGSTKP